jgi:GT2 family glycosyltransferase
MTGPLVSVVVPTANRPELLLASLASLLEQTYAEPYEVIVVENGPARGLSRRIEQLAAGERAASVRYVQLRRADANAARNEGVRAGAGALICFVDDDVLAPPGWLDSVVAGVARHPAVDCFGGGVRPLYERQPPRTCARHTVPGTWFERDAEGPVEEVWGCNMAIRREAFERVGLFREGLPVQQETEWEFRLRAAGGEIVFLPEAWVWHHRTARETSFGYLLGDAFLRGLTLGRIGVASAPQRTPVRIARLLAHGVLYGCACGFLETSRLSGLLAGLAQRSLEGLGRRSTTSA